MDNDGRGQNSDGRHGATAMDDTAATPWQETAQRLIDGDGQRGTVQVQWQ